MAADSDRHFSGRRCESCRPPGQRTARYADSVLKVEEPATTPRALMLLAVLLYPPGVPRSVITPSRQRKSRAWEAELVAYPTTSPAPLTSCP